MIGQVGASVPCRKESPITITHTFFLEIVHGLGSGGQYLLLKGTSGSSLTSVVNLFCSYKPLGEAGVVPEVTRFHPSPSPEVSLTLMAWMDTACLSVADGG